MIAHSHDHEAAPLRLIRAGLIDTPLKLRSLVFFAQFPHHYETPARLAGWVGEEEPQLVAAELEALAAAGLLERSPAHGLARYRLTSAPEHRDAIGELADLYHDAYRRGLLEVSVRLAAAGLHARDAVAA